MLSNLPIFIILFPPTRQDNLTVLGSCDTIKKLYIIAESKFELLVVTSLRVFVYRCKTSNDPLVKACQKIQQFKGK